MKLSQRLIGANKLEYRAYDTKHFRRKKHQWQITSATGTFVCDMFDSGTGSLRDNKLSDRRLRRIEYTYKIRFKRTVYVLYKPYYYTFLCSQPPGIKFNFDTNHPSQELHLRPRKSPCQVFTFSKTESATHSLGYKSISPSKKTFKNLLQQKTFMSHIYYITKI